jgi:hypothetical protein
MVDDFFGRGMLMPDMLRGGPCRGDLFASFSPDDSKVGTSWCVVGRLVLKRPYMVCFEGPRSGRNHQRWGLSTKEECESNLDFDIDYDYNKPINLDRL